MIVWNHTPYKEIYYIAKQNVGGICIVHMYDKWLDVRIPSKYEL